MARLAENERLSRPAVAMMALVTVLGTHLLPARAIPSQEMQKYLLRVDTKQWIRNLDLADSLNWYDLWKPCTSYERIEVAEFVALSMGDSLDRLGSFLENSPKELILAKNGLLLLPEDSLTELADMDAGLWSVQDDDCLDSGRLTHSTGGPEDGHLFRFDPPSNSLSWFNPDNWYSESLQGSLFQYIPESHLIPCIEDVVEFGASADVSKSGHSYRGHSFKVNFKASSHLEASSFNFSVAGIRVSKLRIGDQFYSQSEFEALVSSTSYRNFLFEFNSSKSLLKSESDPTNPIHTLLTIDESSVIADLREYDLCNDEAGCWCGNENQNIMKAICSFQYPIEEDEFPCLDPIVSAGYCNKICGTTLTIHMEPSKFTEAFFTSLMHSIVEQRGDEYFKKVFMGQRRISVTRYEATFRPVVEEASNLEEILAREKEVAHYLYEKLSDGKWFFYPFSHDLILKLTITLRHSIINQDAIKSFYGVKAVTLESSVKWRKDNRVAIFWTLLVVSIWVATSLFVYREQKINIEPADESLKVGPMQQLLGIWTQVAHHYRRLTNNPLAHYESETVSGSESAILSQADSEIPLDALGKQ